MSGCDCTLLVMNGVRTGSLNWLLTSVITSRMDSNLANMSSVPSACPPIRLDIFGSTIEY